MDLGDEEPAAKKVHIKSGMADVWYPTWDIRKGDSLFKPNEGGRFVNMSAFDTFLLPCDQSFLEEVDVEESFGAAMGHMSWGLAFLTSRASRVSALVNNHRKLEESAEKANKELEDPLGQRNALQKKYDKRGWKVQRLEDEKKDMAKQLEDMKTAH